MSGPVRMPLGGDEREVRPLSAAALLRAKKQARELASELDCADEDAELVLAAAVAAESVSADGEPVFESAAAALEALTAEELFAVASLSEASPPYRAVETSAERRAADTQRETSAERRETAGFTEAAEASSRREAVESEEREPPKRREVHIYHDVSEPESYFAGPVKETASYRPSPEYVSDFFRRDSRRYDGGFERY